MHFRVDWLLGTKAFCGPVFGPAAAALCLSFSSSAVFAESIPCAPKATCFRADTTGQRNEEGDYLAQCAGRFPDYLVPLTQIPKGYGGPFFSLAQDFPSKPPIANDLPWSDVDFKAGKAQADEYLYALRDYAFEGMIEAEFIPSKNDKRAWYHVPLMNFHKGRELVRGLTEERLLMPPELGLKNKIRNYAVGFYNDIGAYTIGRVWEETNNPDLAASLFSEGAMVFKILFSAARAEDFEAPDKYILEGAPEWSIATGDGELTPVRLLQMDVAVRDDRAEETGWVFGTLAFDRDARDPISWNRMRPVGLMWGDDPGYTPEDQEAGKPLRESIVSDEITDYAKGHLGWAGRVNGPVDNPKSSCMSCHSTAQYPVAASMIPDKACDTDQKKLHWFRNLSAEEPFGRMGQNTCKPIIGPEKFHSLDFSLQLQVAVQSLLHYHNVNTCTPGSVQANRFTADEAFPLAPRVER